MKRNIFLTVIMFSFIAVFLAALSAQAALDPTLKMYLPLDEGAGAGTAYDATTNGHDGTIYGTAGQSAEYGNSVYLDGGTNRIYVPDHADWSLGSENFTVSLRVKYNSFNGSGNSELLIGKYNDSDTHRGWIVYSMWNGTGVGFRYSTNGTNEISHNVTVPLMFTGTWYDIMVTRTSSTDTRIYVDGAQMGTTYTTNYAVHSPASAALYMGDRTNSSPTQNLNGWLDDAALYNGRGMDSYEVGSVGLVGIENFENINMGINTTFALSYTTEQINFLAKLYDDGRDGLNPDDVIIGDLTWHYYDTLPDEGSHVSGEAYRVGDSYNIRLASGIGTLNTPEPSSIFIALLGLGTALRRRFYR